ncbi:hypothetical protein IEN85_06035 [Pelagicoccus sp. NFK12]|uniref:ATPase BadF/BadG/BcrA/BcrD type domain-containing protein n=1 Tax=Pelagicoccus enzymogenes TaxID=2773457 RepID=A0A927F8C9_9BACT|nr:BadF/BadG/BcrA/BcrD ATPase family protein [Pelagicoccus enzymogenes]MBD5779045.1 hypothetical protein [Pelagicoccus enzymogenes]
MSNPQSSSISIGVDGGGTSTRAIAIGATASVIGTGQAPGCNPNNVGYPLAASHILQAIQATSAPITPATSLCLGIAGLATAAQRQKLRQHLTSIQPDIADAKLILTHDLEIAHYAAFAGQPGIVLVAGTGSACFAKDPSGKAYRASGRDFHYDDPGSGYAIGKRAMDAQLLPPAEGRAAIAALAPRIIELAKEGNAKALETLRLEAEQLAKLAQLVYYDYAQSAPSPILALTGSILTTPSLYRETVHQSLRDALPGLKLVELSTSPAQAAAQMARG